jgi:transposase-like protein
MTKRTRYSPEVRHRAVGLVFEQESEHESQWAAIESVASKIGCTSETLRKWVRQAERDLGRRDGMTTSDRERLTQAELDRRPK